MKIDLDIDLQTAPVERGHALLEDFDRLRENEPVFWSEQTHCWIITRHADVVAMFQRKFPVTNADRMWAIFRNLPRDQWETRVPNLYKYSQLWITSTEGPQHTRLRSLLMKALNRRIVESFRPFARARAEYLMDIAVAEGDIEFNERISRAMTGHVLFSLIGMPESLFPSLQEWATGLMEGAGATNPSPEQLERADRALLAMKEAVIVELDKRRVEPKDDLITALLNASDGDDRLSVDEIVAQMHTVIVAGHDTTMNTLTLAVEALSHHPEAWAYIHENPDKIADCVAEIQRYVAMSLGQARLVYEDFELHGKTIRKGDMMIGLIAGANRDPAVFADADKLDLTRDNRNSMVFAPGVHFCLGHMLAKMQLTEFLSVMVEKARGVEVLDDPLDFMPVWVFRGFYTLHARFTPRAA
jgi:cytochrome P450